MTHPTENTTSTNTATVFPNSSQKNQTEGSLRGRKVSWDLAVQPVLPHVLSNLPGKDFCRTAAVSSSTHKVYDKDQVWKEKLKTEMNVDLSDLPKIANISFKDIYVQIAKHRKALLQLRLNRCEEASDIEVMLKIAEMQKNFDPEEAADTLRQASCILRESFDNNVSNYWFETYFPLVFRVFDAQKGIDLKEATDTLNKSQKILMSSLQQLDLSNYTTQVIWTNFFFDLVERRRRINPKEAIRPLNEAKEIFEKKGIKNIFDIFCDESIYLEPAASCFRDDQKIIPDFSKWIKLMELISSKDKITHFIREIQKILSAIKRNKFLNLQVFIDFVEARRKFDLDEAINDLREARNAIQDPNSSEDQLCDALRMIIASEEAKIDPEGAANDLYEAYQMMDPSSFVKDEFVTEIVIRRMKINPKTALEVFLEAYENFPRHRNELIRMLWKIEVDLPIIFNKKDVNNVVDLNHRTSILIWFLASTQARMNADDVKDILNEVSELIINETNSASYLNEPVFYRLAEINPSKAYEIFNSFSDMEYHYLESIPKITYEKIKQAKTEEDLKEVVEVLKKIDKISVLGRAEELPYIFLGLYHILDDLDLQSSFPEYVFKRNGIYIYNY